MNEDDDTIIITATNKDQLELDLDDLITVKLDSGLSTMAHTLTGAAGAAGQVLTTNGSGGYNWNNTTGGYTLNTSITTGGTISGTWATGSPYTYNDTITLGDYSIGAGNGALEVKGDANFSGDIKLKGKSLSEVLDNIEKRLAILHPNPELEGRWDELKALGERYRELEKEILEKEQMWDILKK